MRDIDSILRTFENFTSGVRVSMLIDRGVQNSKNGSKRWINKLISYDPETFTKNIEKLISLQDYLNDINIRLYSSVNSRNMDKSINHFKHKQLYIWEDDKFKFYSGIKENFVSSLMVPENRESNFWLLDWDREETVPLPEIVYILTYKTPNGFHTVCERFNPVLLNGVENVEIKKDALLLLRTLE